MNTLEYDVGRMKHDLDRLRRKNSYRTTDSASPSPGQIRRLWRRIAG